MNMKAKDSAWVLLAGVFFAVGFSRDEIPNGLRKHKSHGPMHTRYSHP